MNEAEAATAVTEKPGANHDEGKGPKDSVRKLPELRTLPDGPGHVETLPIGDLDVTRNVRQIRKEELEELVASVKSQGVLHPVLAVPYKVKGPSGAYRVIDGHRRIAAAKAAGLKEVPVLIRGIEEQEVITAQLSSNLHRSGLTEIEEARAFGTWLAETGRKQQELAAEIGKSPSYVSNRLRLLKLDPLPLAALEKGGLSASNAEILLSVPPEARVKQGGKEESLQTLIFLESKGHHGNLEYLTRRRVEDYKAAVRLKVKAAKAKFPTCPTPKCGAPPVYNNYADVVQCAQQHPAWDLNKAPPKPTKQRSFGSSRGAERRAERAQEKREDLKESPLLRSAHSPYELALALLQQAGEKGVTYVNWKGGDDAFDDQDGRIKALSGDAVIKIRVSVAALKVDSADIVAVPVPYTTGERSQVRVRHAHDADVKKQIRGQWAKWEGSNLRKAHLAAKGKPAELPADILKGGMDEVCPRLSKLMDNPEILELAREAEAKGKARSGVLGHIDGLLGVARFFGE